MPSPKITIITPTYNSASTIVQCIENVATQTYRNIEHWIVDGKSDDSTVELVKDLSIKFSHLHFMSQADQGIYDAMNKGIALSTGEWIYFLGSDDKLYNDEVLTKIFTTKQYQSNDVIYGDVFSTRFNGLYAGEFDPMKLIRQNICHQAIFFRKSVFKRTGFFDLHYKAYADWAHNLKWFFDDHFKKQYVPIIVANYADGGFSSIVEDKVFQNIKPLLVLRYGQGHFSSKWNVQWAKHFAKEAIKQRNFIHFIQYLFFYIKIKIQASLTK